MLLWLAFLGLGQSSFAQGSGPSSKASLLDAADSLFHRFQYKKAAWVADILLRTELSTELQARALLLTNNSGPGKCWNML